MVNYSQVLEQTMFKGLHKHRGQWPKLFEVDKYLLEIDNHEDMVIPFSYILMTPES